MLDRLPAWLRHLLIVFGSTFLGVISAKVIAAGGVTTLDWIPVLKAAVDYAALATASAAVVLWGLPVTRQYGVGKNVPGDPEQ